MKLYRYMSMKEFTNLSAGCDLVNKNRFQKCRTGSEGFCFLPENSNGFDPIQALNFLHGIVTNDILVEFEVDSELVTKSFGYYNNPYECYDAGSMCVTEYCAQSYNRDTFRPLRYCLPDFFNLSGTTWFNFN